MNQLRFPLNWFPLQHLNKFGRQVINSNLPSRPAGNVSVDHHQSWHPPRCLVFQRLWRYGRGGGLLRFQQGKKFSIAEHLFVFQCLWLYCFNWVFVWCHFTMGGFFGRPKFVEHLRNVPCLKQKKIREMVFFTWRWRKIGWFSSYHLTTVDSSEIRLTSWGWQVVPCFTGFYTSQVVIAGILPYELPTPQLASLLVNRPKFSQKGSFSRALAVSFRDLKATRTMLCFLKGNSWVVFASLLCNLIFKGSKNANVVLSDLHFLNSALFGLIL